MADTFDEALDEWLYRYPFPPDVVERVETDFGEQAEVALDMLSEAFLIRRGPVSSDRLVRCAVSFAAGDLDRLGRAIDLYRSDWRDLIMSAEYRRGGPGEPIDVHDYDFNRPFGEAALDRS